MMHWTFFQGILVNHLNFHFQQSVKLKILGSDFESVEIYWNEIKQHSLGCLELLSYFPMIDKWGRELPVHFLSLFTNTKWPEKIVLAWNFC